jgi:hypothetical protein
MQQHLSAALMAAALFLVAAKPIVAAPKEPEPAPKKAKITFPTFVPGSRIVIGEGLVSEVNALGSKEEQIQFLLKILPPSEQMERLITDRQLYAFRLLGLSDSDAVIGPLLDRLDFMHKGDGWPAVHALGRQGERAVEPIVKRLETVGMDRQKAICLGAALIEIKNKQYPMLIEHLRRRKDIKMRAGLLDELLENYTNAPD